MVLVYTAGHGERTVSRDDPAASFKIAVGFEKPNSTQKLGFFVNFL